MDMLKSVHIEGFKSIRDATIDLGPLTVLIGANGSGKSNFVSFLQMLRAMADGDLQGFVGRAGGANNLLYFGAEVTPSLSARIEMQTDVQEFALDYAESNALWPRVPSEWYPASWAQLRTYHFHNTSMTSAIRQPWNIVDNRELRTDAGNLASYLRMLKIRHPNYYPRILAALRLAAPFFGDFDLEPLEDDATRTQVQLNWTHEKHSEVKFTPHQLSDGSLRTIALLTLLLQPEDRLPSLIVIDEPELGLHPYVISLVAELLNAASKTTQVIVATQSITLLNHFDPTSVAVVDRDEDGGTSFERLSVDRLAVWLDEEFSVGELWEMNVIGGGP